ncbi:10236_t:CDS:2 [Paraglomus brasilianum]|uniref:10236_t:CDS:1 n=1 Tax=Paraglomus brasilianum TaxID=144538 RepID=A0A9N9BUY0_9GLOM|nr:10236_t:CDS:2 [Paraglomus brasilianum]
MSVNVPGFKSSVVFDQIEKALQSETVKKETINKTKGVFELGIKNAEGKEQIWTLDLKKEGTVKTGKAGKADCTIKMDDAVFIEIASGKLNSQKAFMTGKMKITGNIMLSTKLNNVLELAPRSKL